MKPLVSALTLLAFLAALAAVGFLLLGPSGPKPPAMPTAFTGREAAPAPGLGPAEAPRGGIYAGMVVDQDQKGVPYATVFLLKLDTGDARLHMSGQDPDVLDPSQIARVEYETAAQAKTDAAGRFRIAADANAMIRMLAAGGPGFVPVMVSVGGPQEGMQVQLEPAGSFKGYVIDDETGRPVSGAVVSVYLQQVAAPPAAAIGDSALVPKTKRKTSPFAKAQRWVSRVLGPLVWGVDWSGDESLRLYTDDRGMFQLAPLGDAVQLEFVITHPDYMWTEQDQDAEGHVRRTVVPPGQKVERTFRLKKGKTLDGRVLDEHEHGIPDVLVSIEHVAQYHQHWWYRTHKRVTRTRSDGSFHVGGLSYGPYTATLTNPSFGSEFIPQVPENAKDLRWYVKDKGGITASVEGLPKTKSGVLRKGVLRVESTDGSPERGVRLRFDVLIRSDGTFEHSGLEAGRWSMSVGAADESSLPQDVEVKGLETTPVKFVLGGGGRLTARVANTAGRIVDPATFELIRLEKDGVEQRLGVLVSREGRLEAEGILPGRYRLEASAPGYASATGDPFEIRAGGSTDAGEYVLSRPGNLVLLGILGPDGRAVSVSVTLSLREGSDGAFRQLPPLQRSEVPVRPGAVTLRALGSDGTKDEQTFQVGDGQQVPVTIHLHR